MPISERLLGRRSRPAGSWLLRIAAFALLFAGRAFAQEPTEIAWGGISFTKVGATGAELDTALAQAREGRQPLLLFFT